jgi:hypothetical protein
MFEPSQTITTGDWHDGDIPAHVHSTTGTQLQAAVAPLSTRPPGSG